MNENYQAETMEATESTEGTPEVDLGAFDEGWDGDGQTDNVTGTEAEVEDANSETEDADQQSEETAVDNPQADNAAKPDEINETAKAAESADQRFTLKHLDETREVSREEVIALAQKGMDYDRKTTKLNAKIAGYEDFFKELAGELTPEQFMDSVRAKMLVQSEEKAGKQISESEALFKIQNERTRKERAAEDAAQQEAQQKAESKTAKTNEAIALFAKTFPTVKPTDIPETVWNDFHQTGDLVGAYTRHENSLLKSRLEALENNAKNAARSIGSKKTAGNAKAMDDFDAGWDSI